MGRFRTLKNSLLGGQVSRDAVGRTDLPQYAHACELLENMIPLLSGGAYRRPGTMFQDYIPANNATPNTAGNAAYYQSSPPRIFPFIVQNNLSYAIVIGTLRWAARQATPNPRGLPGGAYMQFYRATGNTNEDVVSTITSGTTPLPYRCKSSAAAVTATDQCIYTRQGGPGAVANAGVNAAISPVTILDVADSLQIYDDDIWTVQYCQANDVMFLTHPDYRPQVIYLNAPDDLRALPYDSGLGSLQLGQSRPYLNQSTTGTTLEVTWTGSITVGVTQGTLTSSANLFDPLHAPRSGCTPEGMSGSDLKHDGAIFALKSSTVGTGSGGGIMYVQVVSVTSPTVAIVTFITAPSSIATTYTTAAWWESAWSNFRGWPRSCAVYEQRLAFASTKHQANAIWFTATGAFGAPVSQIATGVNCKFTALGDGPDQGVVAGATGVLANGKNYDTPQDWNYYPVDDAQGDSQSTGPLGIQPFRISLATTTLDAIQYMSSDQQLFIGTGTQEWIVAPVNGAFDVANSIATIQSHYGSDNVQAIRIGYEMMFVHQKKDEIRAYQYNYFDQSFFGEPVQLMFDEYPQDEEGPLAKANPYAGRKKFRQIDWDASRSTLWCVDTAGSFFGLTRDRKLQVTAWHTHQIGGFNSAHGQGQNQQDNLTLNNFYTDSANYQCDGSVISACTTPNPLSGIRDIWMIVKRSYQGGSNTIWSVERVVGANTVRQTAYSAVAPGNAQEPLYVDCAYFLTDNGSPTNFNYVVGAQLEGDTLIGTYYSQAWGMFAIGTQAAVDGSGNIALQTSLPPDYGNLAEAHTIVVGLPYSSIVQPVRIDPPSEIGTSQGAIKRISKAYVRLFKTLMLKVGSVASLGATPLVEVVSFAQPASMAQSSEIFTGDAEVLVPAQFDRSGYMYLLQDQPLPFTLVSISMEGTEYNQ